MRQNRQTVEFVRSFNSKISIITPGIPKNTPYWATRLVEWVRVEVEENKTKVKRLNIGSHHFFLFSPLIFLLFLSLTEHCRGHAFLIFFPYFSIFIFFSFKKVLFYIFLFFSFSFHAVVIIISFDAKHKPCWRIFSSKCRTRIIYTNLGKLYTVRQRGAFLS